MTPPILLIAGPTASGKTALALDLAERLAGEVVNADAMQVYKDLCVLTARPARGDEARARHHLFGHVDAAERYSVGRWTREALGVIADIRERGRRPILAGGTGLYFRALTHGLADIPDISPETRAAVDEETDTAQARGVTLRALAEDADPDAVAGVLGDDPVRLRRILEVRRETGRTLSDWRVGTQPLIEKDGWRGLVIEPQRDALYERINARVKTMLAAGAAEEAAALSDRGLNPDLPAMKALGVDILAELARGRASKADAIAALQRDTRRYAKRQLTWLRNQTPEWPRLDGPHVDEALATLADDAG